MFFNKVEYVLNDCLRIGFLNMNINVSSFYSSYCFSNFSLEILRKANIKIFVPIMQILTV